MKRKLVSLFLSLSLMVVSVTGCQSDSVTEETKKEVQTKKSQVLSLYKEIETMIQKNHIEADAGYDRRGCKTSHHRVKAIRNKFAANKEKCRGTHCKIRNQKKGHIKGYASF